MRRRKTFGDLLFYGVLFLFVVVALFSALQILEGTVLNPAQELQTAHSKTITRDGVDYFPRQDITTILVMGIDRKGPVADSESYQNPGAADMVMLLIFDEAERVCDILYLNRDTMVEMPVLGIGGRQAGTWYGQLALSHTYGSGLHDSCENTCQTVSDLLYGARIDYYAAMHMDAIPILNDAVGGVTVTVTDDFSAVDPDLQKGVILLKGDQAVRFVQSRSGVGDQLNLSRMERQKAYVDSFTTAFRSAADADEAFTLKIYDQIAPYLVTDCSVNAITGMIDRYSDYRVREVVSPAGENVLDGEYYEFHLDEAALDALILRLLYAPK